MVAKQEVKVVVEWMLKSNYCQLMMYLTRPVISKQILVQVLHELSVEWISVLQFVKTLGKQQDKLLQHMQQTRLNISLNGDGKE